MFNGIESGFSQQECDMTGTVNILLSSYNGEKYIAEQLDSLLAQSYSPIFIHIRDDGSTDGTPVILEEYSNRYSAIKLDLNSNIGAINSFFTLIKQADRQCDYFALCDQDDVWNTDKIELSVQKMQEAECCYGSGTPLLVHSDLAVVDEDLQPIASSFFKMQHMDSRRSQLNHLVVQNIVTGCTVLFNGALLDIIDNAPVGVLMHDWWIALVASAFGKIVFLDQPTVKYRQHSNNVVGAHKANTMRDFKRKISSSDNYKRYFQSVYHQGEAFAARYADDVNASQSIMIKSFGNCQYASKALRIKALFKYRLWRKGIARKIVQIIYC